MRPPPRRPASTGRRAARRQIDEVSAGRFTGDRDAARIEVILGGMRLDPADRRFDIIDAGRIEVLGSQSVVDFKPGEAGPDNGSSIGAI